LNGFAFVETVVTAQYDTTGYQPIFTIDQAIAANSYLPDNQYVKRGVPELISGDVDKGFAQSQVVLEGTLYTGAQTIFYMETQTAVVQLEENDVFKVYSSTQGAADTRMTVATVLGVPSSRVIVEGGRMGGGFGGKLTRGRPIAAAAALATKLLRRQVRMQMSRTEDMTSVGMSFALYDLFDCGFY
jgi:xanthine dehydrogenase molybdopterin-binding subunit B